MTAEERKNFKIPKHDHINSVFVRCEDCLMFGIPGSDAYGEVECGNCQHKTTRWYVPSCCVNAVIEETREVCAKIADEKMDEILAKSKCESSKLEMALLKAAGVADDIAQAIRARK